MALEWPNHSPGEVLDYYIDWTFALDGDSINMSVFSLPVIVDENMDSVDDAGLEIVSASNTAHFTGVWLRGGVDGMRGTILNTITTNGGRKLEQTVQIPIGQN